MQIINTANTVRYQKLRSMFPSRSLFRAGLILLSAGICAAGDDAQAPQKPDIEFIKCRVSVVDPHGEPVGGAFVTPWALCPRREPQAHWGWKESRLGPRPRAKTGADGTATLKVAKFAMEKVEVGLVTWQVDHRDFVIYREDHNINDAPAEIKLQDGYRIAATAIDAETKAPIKEHLFAHMNGDRHFDFAEWNLAKSGVLLSRTFDAENFFLRLIALPPDGPALYSELLAVDRVENGSRVFLRNIPLHRGVRVQGKIDDAVPRPIKAGKVIAYISAGPIVEDPHLEFEWWWWEDYADIQPDGTFEFTSLPRGDIVQLIAVCDGWVSRTPNQAEIQSVVPWKYDQHISNRVLPHVFALDEETIQPTIAMDRTVACKTTVLDPSGKPLPGAVVLMWPNQILLRGGGTLLGFGFRVSESLRALAQGKKVPKFSDWKSPYQATTNAEGIATIYNLPSNGNVGLLAEHPQFVQPIEKNRRSTYVGMKPDETTEITIRMEPKGENELGGP
ncbi:hypothetical protein CA54_02010 [Symmachiella macrocystis]|uniref:Uncharacterized protein n=1 Tax=Symmachiella macrocystis TaxID=2527985 RepID=A0A5C6BLM8_9PLAN|nr:hypothetical protein [Symmachiella macrocystis]TWU11394.1 hypothetical protein CA54_02010 [Symmachiella macrocystis]